MESSGHSNADIGAPVTTATQKTILSAFGISEDYLKQDAEILAAYEKRGRTFEEVMKFLKTAPSCTSTQSTGKRKGRPKKIAE